MVARLLDADVPLDVMRRDGVIGVESGDDGDDGDARSDDEDDEDERLTVDDRRCCFVWLD